MDFRIILNKIMAKYGFKTLREFADRTQIKYTSVRNWSAGKCEPDKMARKQICESLGITEGQLFSM